MAGSPFAVFRRNQKQLMVVLTGLAMFAFVFLDSVTMQSGQLPRSLMVVLVAMICAGGFWVIGSPRGKGSELALYGALIGGVVAFFGLGATGTATVVQTSIGSFSRTDLQSMAQRRGYANRFVMMATKGAGGGFGGTDDRSLVERAILLHEAKGEGIRVSNEAVSDFISQITENKLARSDYRALLRDLGIQEGELFDILREELEARQALMMEIPAGLASDSSAMSTPLEYWRQYKLLEVRQTADVVAVPVEPFVAMVPEPKDSEVAVFFDSYKNQLPRFDGEPGFMQDRKVDLAYVAADFEEFEKMAAAPTDEEIAAYYEANKERYRVLGIPEGMTNDQTPDFPEDTAPASALEPANTPAPAAPAGDEAKPKAEEPGASPAAEKPSSEAAQPEKAKETSPPSSPESGQAGRAPGNQGLIRLASFTQADGEAAPTAKPAEAAPDEAPKTEAKTAAESPSLTVPPAPTTPELTLPPSPGEKKVEVEPKYRELDAGLKLEISETILRDRAFEAMGKAVDGAIDEMTVLADDYLGVYEADEQAKKAEVITQRLKAYAQKNKLKYVETGLMTRDELTSSVSETIGAAVAPSPNQFQRGAPVAESVFETQNLFDPRRADSMLRDKRYAYWKIADVAPRVPELKEVREKVIAAWKLAQARPLAEKRAQELAELVKKGSGSITEALSGQTVTGKPESNAVSVRETPRFSWLSLPRNLAFQFNPMFMPPPQLSVVDGVVQPGFDFMKTVFDELSPGETGVAVNQPKSIYYVVKIKDRDGDVAPGGDDLPIKALQQQFLTEARGTDGRGEGFDKPPYAYLTREQMQMLYQRWRQSYDQRYAVAWLEQEPTADQVEP